MYDKHDRITKDGIRLHSAEDFAGMRQAGLIAARILDDIAEHVVVGQHTGELDRLIEAMVQALGAKSATIGYRGYRHASCISLNHVVCHGIPGSVTPTARNEVTHTALMKGIEAVRPGNTFGDIGHAIQSYVEGQRMAVVRDFCGHGLGRVFHAPPNVLHYGRPGREAVLEEGMFFTIEPMVNLGRPETKVLADEWTAITRDKSLSAQFEHSVGVTATGCEIFTASPAGRFHPTWT